jgi:hypothetical protein
MPCHHSLAEALRAYIDAAGIAEVRKGFLYRTSRGHRCVELSEQPMMQPDAWRMIRKRAARSSMLRRWRRTRARGRRSSTTGRNSA